MHWEDFYVKQSYTLYFKKDFYFLMLSTNEITLNRKEFGSIRGDYCFHFTFCALFTTPAYIVKSIDCVFFCTIVFILYFHTL